MDKRKLMLLLGALVVAIVTALAARSMLAGGSAPAAEAAQQAQGPKVLVAQRALPVGTIITQDAISYTAWPKESATPPGPRKWSRTPTSSKARPM